MAQDDSPRSSFPPSSTSVGLQRQAETAALGEAIAELASRIQAATFDLLVMIREFDQREGWGGGFTSCAHWLNWRTGLALGAAREKVRVARALGDLPRLSDAMRRGAISFSKARAITRVATPDTEERLLDFARCATAAHVERLVRAWRRVDRIAETEDDRRRHASRHLDMWVDEDGMLVVRGRLSPEVGAGVQRALEAATDRLYHESRDNAEVSAGQRRADALGMVAESALSSDLDGGTAGDRYQVVVHVDEEGLENSGRAGQSALEDGVRVSAGTSRRSPATPRPWSFGTTGMGPCWTWGARLGRFRRPSAAHSAPETADVAFPAATRGGAMRTTCGTGPMAARPGSTIWCCCAGVTTGRFTKGDLSSSWAPTSTPPSFDRTVSRSLSLRRPPSGPDRHWRRSMRDSKALGSPFTPARPLQTGMASHSISTGPSSSCIQPQPTRCRTTFPRERRLFLKQRIQGAKITPAAILVLSSALGNGVAVYCSRSLTSHPLL